MNTVKRYGLIAFCALLAGCGGGDSSEVTCDNQYWDGTFGMCLTEGWIALDSETLRQRGVPAETIVAFQAEEAIAGQFPTIAVTKERLASETDAMRYSEASIRSVAVLNEYALIDAKEMTIDGHDVKMHVFTARPLDGEPARRFYQLSTTIRDLGFTVTAVTPLSIEKKQQESIELMLSQVTFTDPTPKEEDAKE